MGNPVTTKQLIGARIKQLRKGVGLSQEKLSEKIGMSSKYLSSIERGYENPTLDAFIKIARGLDVDVYELFNYSGDRSRKVSQEILLDLIKSTMEAPSSKLQGI